MTHHQGLEGSRVCEAVWTEAYAEGELAKSGRIPPATMAKWLRMQVSEEKALDATLRLMKQRDAIDRDSKSETVR